MQSLQEFTKYLQEVGKSRDWQSLAEAMLSVYLPKYSQQQGVLDYVRHYCSSQIAGFPDAERRLAILFWYHNLNGDIDIATYLITLFGTEGVIESQMERLTELFGKQITENVMQGLKFPPLGSDLNSYPHLINKYLTAMQALLPLEACKKVLAGNHHRLNPEQFAPEKDYFIQADGIANYLENKHKRLISRLQDHADSGKLWYEQVITQEVVDYVSQNQEIQTGVLQGSSIIVSKIPYAPDAWLKESDSHKKRYLACHCPFVRNSIPKEIKVDSLWCYCTGGFTKLLFDYLFGQNLEVILLSSVLDGAESCRFAISIPPTITENNY